MSGPKVELEINLVNVRVVKEETVFPESGATIYVVYGPGVREEEYVHTLLAPHGFRIVPLTKGLAK